MYQIINSLICLHADRNVNAAHAFSKFCYFKFGDSALCGQIILVSDDDDVLDGELAVVVVLVDPLVEVVEALLVRDVEHQHAAVGAAVIARRQRAKPLLARRVPQLQPHAQVPRAVPECAGLAVNSNCCIISVFSCQWQVLSYSHEQSCLASVLISNDNNLELLVILLLAFEN